MLKFDRDGLSFGRRPEQVHRPNELLEQSFTKTMVIYFVVLCIVLGGSVIGVALLDMHPARPALVLLGIVCILAGIGRPRALYLTLRSMRRANQVSDPLTLRKGLLAFGTLFVVAGIFLPSIGRLVATWF